MKLKRLTFMGLCACLALTACKKNNDDNKKEEPSSPIVGTWKLSAYVNIKRSGSQADTTDIYVRMAPCGKDDLLRFNADRTIVSLSGASKCDPVEPDSSVKGKWSLMNNNTRLVWVNNNGDTGNYAVTTLNATTLTMRDLYIPGYSERYTFTRQ